MDCDEQQRNVLSILAHFAHQLADQSYPLKHFSERYDVYQQKVDEIERDPEAPQGLAAVIGRTLVRSVYIAGDLIPGLRKGLEYIPQDALETQASDWATYLGKKITNKDEQALVRDPIGILTPLFFKDLNEVAKKRRILLCFENYEETRDELQEWLLRLRNYKPSQDIRILIASRTSPGPKWDPLRGVTQTFSLDVFTEQEAKQFLDIYSIVDMKRRVEILELSGRLPVLMSWLAAPENPTSEPSIPTTGIVDRFLRWISRAELRQTALLR